MNIGCRSLSRIADNLHRGVDLLGTLLYGFQAQPGRRLGDIEPAPVIRDGYPDIIGAISQLYMKSAGLAVFECSRTPAR